MTRPLHLSKYEASGNDFLIVDDLSGELSGVDARPLCDRRRGLGADGLIRALRGAGAPFGFALANADGSPAELSGNGLRCLAAWLRDRGHVEADATFDVDTPAGIRRVWLRVAGATVAMGVPDFTKAAIPMRGPGWETFEEVPFDAGEGSIVTATALSMGNPHLVLFTEEDPEQVPVERLGPALEHHEWFPERTNVEFARLMPDGIDVRVWERGVGETLSCGTGACAVAAAANEAGFAPPNVSVRFRGGALDVERRPDGEVLLGGPVRHVYEAEVDLDEFGA